MARVYDSLASFYHDPARSPSPERDVGLRWLSADGRSYRAAWISDTGELYAVEHKTRDGRGGSVEILATLAPPAVDELVAGAREVCGRPASYEWLRERASRVGTVRRRERRRGAARRRFVPLSHIPAFH